MSIEINKWLAGERNYEEGIALLEQADGNSYYIELFKRNKSPFTVGKLTELLEEESKKGKVEEVKEVVLPQQPQSNKKPYVKAQELPRDEESVLERITQVLPQKIQMMKNERGELFKETLTLRKEIKELLQLKTNGFITVKDALSVMDQVTKWGKSKHFSITYVTWNDSYKSGGKVIRWERATIANLNLSGSRIVNDRKVNKPHRLINKNPNHWANNTRNINPEGSLEVRKLHIWLILELNGQEVTMSEGGDILYSRKPVSIDDNKKQYLIERAAGKIVGNMKRIGRIWQELDYFEENGRELPNRDLTLKQQISDLSIGEILRLYDNLPPLISRWTAKEKKMEDGPKRESLRINLELKKAELAAIKELKNEVI